MRNASQLHWLKVKCEVTAGNGSLGKADRLQITTSTEAFGSLGNTRKGVTGATAQATGRRK